MVAKIRKQLTVIKHMSKSTSEQMLSCAKGIEAQTSKKTMLETLKDNKEFDMISKTK